MGKTTLEISKKHDKITFNIQDRNDYYPVVNLIFSSGKKYEIVVRNAVGGEVYKSSQGKFYTQAVEEITIQQHEKVSWKEVWKISQLPQDKYSVHAVIVPYEIKPAQVNIDQLQVRKAFVVR